MRAEFARSRTGERVAVDLGLRLRRRPTLSALAVLWGSALLVLSRGLAFGEVYWEGDTASYYLPVMQTYQAALRHASLPLWTPYLFGGQPLFAEGEGGMLYPVNLALTALLPLGQAYTWQLIVRFGLSGTFAFWFARGLGLSHVPALIGGLVFAFSSFMVGQMHHSNVADSAVWLPAVLASAECAVRARATARLGWILVGGLGLGCAMLAVHVEPVLMIAALLGVWCAFRAVPLLLRQEPVGPARRLLRDRVLAASGVALIAPAMLLVGLGLGAVQLLPLYELSQVAARGEGLSYGSASNFALGPADLITALFPFFFQGPDNRWWSLWVQWETTLYIGVAPLVLAVIGVAFVRRPETWLFGAVALVGVLLALGDTSPINLFWLVWHIPGLSFLRAPGRFSLLAAFSGAMLTAYGIQWLIDLRRSAVRLPLLGFALLSLDVGLVVLASVGRFWLEADPAGALAFIRDRYLTLPHDLEYPVDPALVVRGLLLDADLSQGRSGLTLVLLAGLGALLLGWWFLSRWPTFRLGALSSLVAVDLLVFATTFHQVAPIDALIRPTPAARFLASQGGDYRVFSGTAPPAGVEPDRLLALRVPDAGGYSSLAVGRVQQYLKQMPLSGGVLLDLMHVRYLLNARRGGFVPTYAGVAYDRQHPRVLTNRAGLTNSVSFPASGTRATEVRLVGFLLNDRHVPQGAEIGQVTVGDDAGGSHVMPLRAGVEIADEGIELPLATPAAHSPVEIAHAEPIRTTEGLESRALAYFASLPLSQTVAATTVRLNFTYPDGELDVLGVALVDAGGAVRQLAEEAAPFPPRSAPAGRQVYADDAVEVTENATVMDRAFLVYAAAPAPAGPAALDVMAAPPFDPRSQVLLEGTLPDDVTGPPPAPSSVTILDQADDRHVTLQVQTAAPAVLVLADAAYPGWRATVDGDETPILTADYVFRAVHVPSGEHTIAFSYQPATFRIGALVATTTLIVAACLALGLWWQRANVA